MTAAIYLPSLYLSQDELDLVTRLQTRLHMYQPANAEKADYYSGKQALKDMGIAIPPTLRGMAACIGWPGTAVDVLEERLDLKGWSSPGEDFGLEQIFSANDLDVEASLAHLDALIYGTAFVAVSSGMDNEPDPLITVESPTCMTAVISPRTRRVEAALSVRYDEDGKTVGGVLYLPDATIWLDYDLNGWTIVNRDDHNLGRVPVAQLVNRPRSGALGGRSEITEAVRSYTDSAMRTLAASEVAREFYAAPQRVLLGAPESFFLDEDGNPRSGWEAYMGRFLGVERDDTGELPAIQEFRGSSLSPYFEQIRTLSQLLSAEASIPAHYLGFVTDNPTSADAIRQGEARLVKRAERRQRMFGRAWTEVARLCMLVRDGAIPEPFSEVRPDWTSAATPTDAADADRVTKLIASDVLQPDSVVTYNELGYSPDVQKQLALDKRRATVTDLIQAVRPAAQAAQQDPQVGEIAARTVDNG